ncbi:MAG: cobaltochelatase subunit CobN, partial [Rhodospirillaceae bacterium]|nr:cobaltochelatase subunit CobN [Rhodospirillaceae bacterium]
MHLLAAQPGGVSDAAEAVDLEQTPGEIVVVSAADTEIACLAAAQRARIDTEGESAVPSLRLANMMNLTHNLSVDLYVESVVERAKLVVLRILGGRGYWPYGVDEIVAACRRRSIPLAVLPGDDQPDAELQGLSTLPAKACHRLWHHCTHGGIANARNFLAYAATLIGRDTAWDEPAPLLRAGLYGTERDGLDGLRTTWREGAPVAALVFYRALVQAANTAVIDTLIEALREAGLNPLPVYVTSLKDPVAAATLAELLDAAPPAVILNGTGFSVSAPGRRAETPFDGADCPVLQIVFAGGTEEAWREGTRGLSARDIAMNVALPEVDGRILARAVSFKSTRGRDPLTETEIVFYRPVPDRIAFTADLAAAWAKLRGTPAEERRVAMVVANYPNRDGRMGNGVGLDTPASAVTVLRALEAVGYDLRDIPEDGA